MRTQPVGDLPQGVHRELRAADGHPRHHGGEHRDAEHRQAISRSAARRSAGRSRPIRSCSAACCCSAAAPPTCSAAAVCSSPASASSRPRRSPRRLAASAAALFAARAGQGLGAAMLSPAALSIITGTFHGPARAKALAAWGAVGGAGAALGVLLGGVLTQVGDWRLIFFINLPVAVALAIGARRIVPADTSEAALARPRRSRRGARHRQHGRDRLRDHPGRPGGLDLGADARHRRRGASPASPSSPSASAAPPSRSCASNSSATGPSAVACCCPSSTPVSCSGCSCSARSTSSSRSAAGRSRPASAFIPLAARSRLRRARRRPPDQPARPALVNRLRRSR